MFGEYTQVAYMLDDLIAGFRFGKKTTETAGRDIRGNIQGI